MNSYELEFTNGDSEVLKADSFFLGNGFFLFQKDDEVIAAYSVLYIRSIHLFGVVEEVE